MDDVWLTTEQAAAELGCSRTHVRRFAQSGDLHSRREGRQMLVSAIDVETLRQARSTWVSLAEGAALTSLSARSIQKAGMAGAIVRRSGPTAVASIDRASLEQWAVRRRAELAEVEAARATRRPVTGPPDHDHEWVGPPEVAARLGVSPARIRQLAREDRLPMTQVGRRWWMRADHLEQVAAARAAQHETPGER